MDETLVSGVLTTKQIKECMRKLSLHTDVNQSKCTNLHKQKTKPNSPDKMKFHKNHPV